MLYEKGKLCFLSSYLKKDTDTIDVIKAENKRYCQQTFITKYKH